MRTFSEYEVLAEQAHGHICAGQILGIRMAIHGLHLLGIEDPAGRDRKRLVTYVEIDRCATDAIGVVTGCRLGKRALKFLDFGKMAATFADLQTGRAVRLSARESSKELADRLHPEIENRNLRQTASYRELPAEALFDVQWVQLTVPPEDLPGFKGPRVVCAECGEGISFKREVLAGGRTLCRSCAGGRYYAPLPDHG